MVQRKAVINKTDKIHDQELEPQVLERLLLSPLRSPQSRQRAPAGAQARGWRRAGRRGVGHRKKMACHLFPALSRRQSAGARFLPSMDEELLPRASLVGSSLYSPRQISAYGSKAKSPEKGRKRRPDKEGPKKKVEKTKKPQAIPKPSITICLGIVSNVMVDKLEVTLPNNRIGTVNVEEISDIYNQEFENIRISRENNEVYQSQILYPLTELYTIGEYIVVRILDSGTLRLSARSSQISSVLEPAIGEAIVVEPKSKEERGWTSDNIWLDTSEIETLDNNSVVGYIRKGKPVLAVVTKYNSSAKRITAKPLDFRINSNKLKCEGKISTQDLAKPLFTLLPGTLMSGVISSWNRNEKTGLIESCTIQSAIGECFALETHSRRCIPGKSNEDGLFTPYSKVGTEVMFRIIESKLANDSTVEFLHINSKHYSDESMTSSRKVMVSLMPHILDMETPLAGIVDEKKLSQISRENNNAFVVAKRIVPGMYLMDVPIDEETLVKPKEKINHSKEMNNLLRYLPDGNKVFCHMSTYVVLNSDDRKEENDKSKRYNALVPPEILTNIIIKTTKYRSLAIQSNMVENEDKDKKSLPKIMCKCCLVEKVNMLDNLINATTSILESNENYKFSGIQNMEKGKNERKSLLPGTQVLVRCLGINEGGLFCRVIEGSKRSKVAVGKKIRGRKTKVQKVERDILGSEVFIPFSLYHIFTLPKDLDIKDLFYRASIRYDEDSDESGLKNKALEYLRSIPLDKTNPILNGVIGKKLIATILLADIHGDQVSTDNVPSYMNQERIAPERLSRVIATNHPVLVNASSTLPSRFIPRNQIYPFLFDADASKLRKCLLKLDRGVVNDKSGDHFLEDEYKPYVSPLYGTLDRLKSGRKPKINIDSDAKANSVVKNDEVTDFVVGNLPMDINNVMMSQNKLKEDNSFLTNKSNGVPEYKIEDIIDKNISLKYFPRILGSDMLKPGVPVTGLIRARDLDRDDMNTEYPRYLGNYPIKVQLSSTVSAMIPESIMNSFSIHIVNKYDIYNRDEYRPDIYRICKDYLAWKNGSSEFPYKNKIFPVSCESINVIIASVSISGSDFNCNLTVIAVPFEAEEMNDKVLEKNKKDLMKLIMSENNENKDSQDTLKLMKTENLFALPSSKLAYELIRRRFEYYGTNGQYGSRKLEKIRRDYNREFVDRKQSQLEDADGEDSLVRFLNIVKLYNESYLILFRAGLFMNEIMIRDYGSNVGSNEEMRERRFGRGIRKLMSCKLPLSNYKPPYIDEKTYHLDNSFEIKKIDINNFEVCSFVPFGIAIGRVYGIARIKNVVSGKHIFLQSSIDIFELSDIYSNLIGGVEAFFSKKLIQNSLAIREIIKSVTDDNINEFDQYGLDLDQKMSILEIRDCDSFVALTMRESILESINSKPKDHPKCYMPSNKEEIMELYNDVSKRKENGTHEEMDEEVKGKREHDWVDTQRLLTGVVDAVSGSLVHISLRGDMRARLLINLKEMSQSINANEVLYLVPSYSYLENIRLDSNKENKMNLVLSMPSWTTMNTCCRDINENIYKNILRQTKMLLRDNKIEFFVFHSDIIDEKSDKLKKNQENNMTQLTTNEEVFISNGRTYILPKELAIEDKVAKSRRQFYIIVSFGDTFVVSEKRIVSFKTVKSELERDAKKILEPIYDVFGMKLCIVNKDGDDDDDDDDENVNLVGTFDQMQIPMASSINREHMDYYNSVLGKKVEVVKINDLLDRRMTGHAKYIIRNNSKQQTKELKYAINDPVKISEESECIFPIVQTHFVTKRESTQLSDGDREVKRKSITGNRIDITSNFPIGSMVLIDANTISIRDKMNATCNICLKSDSEKKTFISASILSYLVSDDCPSYPMEILKLMKEKAISTQDNVLEAIVYFNKKNDKMKIQHGVLQLPDIVVSLRKSDIEQGENFKGPDTTNCPHKRIGFVSEYYYKQSKRTTNNRGVSLPPIHYLLCAKCGEHVLCLPRDQSDTFKKADEAKEDSSRSSGRSGFIINKNGKDEKINVGDIVYARYIAPISDKSHYGLVSVRPSVVSNDTPVNEVLNSKKFYNSYNVEDGAYYTTVTSTGKPSGDKIIYFLEVNDSYPKLQTRCLLDENTDNKYKLKVGDQFLVVYRCNGRNEERTRSLLEKNILETHPMDSIFATKFVNDHPGENVEDYVLNTVKITKDNTEEMKDKKKIDGKNLEKEEEEEEENDETGEEDVDEHSDNKEYSKEETNYNLFANGDVYLDDFLDDEETKVKTNKSKSEKKLEEIKEIEKQSDKNMNSINEMSFSNKENNDTFYESMILENPTSSYVYIQYAQYLLMESGKQNVDEPNVPTRAGYMKAMSVLNRAVKDDNLMKKLEMNTGDKAKGVSSVVSSIPLTDEFEKERTNILMAKALLIYSLEETDSSDLLRKSGGRNSKHENDKDIFPIFKLFAEASLRKVSDKIKFIRTLNESLCSQCTDSKGRATSKRESILYLSEFLWNICGTKPIKKDPRYWLYYISHILRNEKEPLGERDSKVDKKEENSDFNQSERRAKSVFERSLLSLNPRANDKKNNSYNKETVEYVISYVRLQFKFGNKHMAQEEMEILIEKVENNTGEERLGIEVLRHVLFMYFVYSTSYLSLEVVKKVFRRCISNKAVNSDPKTFFDFVGKMNEYLNTHGTNKDVQELKSLLEEFVHK